MKYNNRIKLNEVKNQEDAKRYLKQLCTRFPDACAAVSTIAVAVTLILALVASIEAWATDIYIQSTNPDGTTYPTVIDYRWYPCSGNCDVDVQQAALQGCELANFGISMVLTGNECLDANTCKKWRIGPTSSQSMSVWVKPDISGNSDCAAWVIANGKSTIRGSARQNTPAPNEFFVQPVSEETRFDIEQLQVDVNLQLSLSADDTNPETVSSPLGDVTYFDRGKADYLLSFQFEDTNHREGERVLIQSDWREVNGGIQTLAFPPNPLNYSITRSKSYGIPLRQNGAFDVLVNELLQADTGELLTPWDVGQQGVAFSSWSIEFQMVDLP